MVPAICDRGAARKTRARCPRHEESYFDFDAIFDSKRVNSSSSCHSRRAFSLAASNLLHAADEGSGLTDSPAHAGTKDLYSRVDQRLAPATKAYSRLLRANV